MIWPRWPPSDAEAQADQVFASFAAHTGNTAELWKLRFDDYRYDPDGEPQQNAASMSLAKGALRSITGQKSELSASGKTVREVLAAPEGTPKMREMVFYHKEAVEAAAKDEAESIKAQLEEAGASVELK